MLVATMVDFQALLDRIDRHDLQLTMDVGHLHCLGELPVEEQILRWGDRIVNVHLEDMVAGVHEHLPLGEGEMDFTRILAALRQIGYQGGVHVELGRHSHVGPQLAEASFRFLSDLSGMPQG